MPEKTKIEKIIDTLKVDGSNPNINKEYLIKVLKQLKEAIANSGTKLYRHFVRDADSTHSMTLVTTSNESLVDKYFSSVAEEQNKDTFVSWGMWNSMYPIIGYLNNYYLIYVNSGSTPFMATETTLYNYKVAYDTITPL